jgi:hypothetical protein
MTSSGDILVGGGYGAVGRRVAAELAGPGSTRSCACKESNHEPRMVVVTGGPGAGKTALLELVRRHFCEHVAVLPEAAGIVFGGGFPRRDSLAARSAAQRAIYHVQCELEACVWGEGRAAVALCDRGTVDGAAYWPGPDPDPWRALGTTLEAELRRYEAVIHLRTPSAEHGYNLSNPLRTESAKEACRLDERIAEVWSMHPRRTVIDSGEDFLEKMLRAVEAIRREVPVCCRSHRIEARDRVLDTDNACPGGG